tara:strand:- start:701 stop:1012 length:312 start_codon:yes stop_codon:yes gene_type:complete
MIKFNKNENIEYNNNYILNDKDKILSENENSILNKNNKKIIKERCYFCNKKLKMINFTCKCDHKFCIIHQNPHSHNCTFDSKTAKKKEIKINNPKLGSKLEKI